MCLHVVFLSGTALHISFCFIAKTEVCSDEFQNILDFLMAQETKCNEYFCSFGWYPV